MNDNETSAITQAKQIMQDYLDALNQRDSAALVSNMHFPHYRLSEGNLKTWATTEDYFADFIKRAGDNWHHTRWGELEVLQHSADKVHFHVRVDRFDADDQLIVSFVSLWVIARIGGRWGAQLRSSFAPDSRFLTAT